MFKLPQELRANIFRHVVGENIYPEDHYDPISRQSKVVFRPKYCVHGPERYNHPEGLGHNAIQRPDLPNYRILAVSKQVRREALEAGWMGTYKHFLAARHLFAALGADVKPTEFNWLSKVHLNFTVKKYFEFFGLRINPQVHIVEANSMGRRLQGLTKRRLEHLELYFRDP